MTYIVKCKHEWQDKQYGAQNRVANKTRTAPGEQAKARCTVCLEVHAVK
jgi:hypothetical protein